MKESHGIARRTSGHTRALGPGVSPGVVTCALILLALSAVAGVVPAEPPHGAQAVHVVLTPDTAHVAAGDEFTLEIRIDAPGKGFNGYDAIVSFDTLAVAHVPAAEGASEEGALMKGACGSTFHRFQARADSVSISHVILCGGVSLTGPGTLHRLRFRALTDHGSTTIGLRRVQFYDAGLFVGPSITRDAVIVFPEGRQG